MIVVECSSCGVLDRAEGYGHRMYGVAVGHQEASGHAVVLNADGEASL